MRALALIVAIAAAASYAAGAVGGDVRGTDPAGDVKAPRLTSAERAAIDIRSVRVLGAEGLGVLVDVKFAGNVEKGLGHGHLASAAVGIVLRPKAGAGTPAGLLTTGAEFSIRTVHLSAKTRRTYVVPRERDLRRTRSTDVQILRAGHDVYFWIWGPGLSNVATVDARSFASLPPRGRLLQQVPRAGDNLWNPFSEGTSSDEDENAPDATELTPGQLTIMKQVEKYNVSVLEKRETEVVLQKDKLTNLRESLGPNAAAAGALKSAEDALQELNDQIVEEIQIANGKITLIDQLLQQSQPPPPQSKSLRGGCSFFDPMEITCQAMFEGGSFRNLAAVSAIDSIKVVVPPSGSTQRTITNQLCPSQLPSPSLPAPDTLVCSGGTLAVGTGFTFDIRMSPAPTAGMGVQVYAGANGSYQGPFTLGGP